MRMLVRAVRLPIVAAGGIMDGAGIAAVLSLGAQAAQIGTAFIPCPESGATETYRAALLAATEDDTTITDRFSGKPARGLRNRFIRESARADFPKLPFPAQSQLTSKLRTAAAQAGSSDFLALWAGQAVSLSRAHAGSGVAANARARGIGSDRASRELAACRRIARDGFAPVEHRPLFRIRKRYDHG